MFLWAFLDKEKVIYNNDIICLIKKIKDYERQRFRIFV